MKRNHAPHALWLSLVAASLPACSNDEFEPLPEPDTVFRVDIETGLELHWTFQDRSGSQILDQSGNARHGTLSGGSFVASAWGEAVSLDGLDDFISFTGPRDPDDFGGESEGAFTISARVQVSDADRYNSLCVGCAPHSLLSIGTSNFGARAYAALHNVVSGGKLWPMSTNPSVSDGTWTTVTMVVEAGQGVTYYTDCQLDSTIADSRIGLKDYGYSAVGEGFNATSWFDGEIDDLRVWSRALSAIEVNTLCTEPIEVPCTGAPEATTLGIGLPTPPSDHVAGTLPDCNDPDVQCGVTPATLQAVITNGPKILVLDDNTYTANDINGDFLSIKGRELWAANSGGVTFEFGVETGGNNGAFEHSFSKLRGIVFDIDDTTHAPSHPASGSTAISAWGDATGLDIEDCIVDGNGVLDVGIYVTSAEGLQMRRLELGEVRTFGMLIEGSGVVNVPVIVEDVRAEHIRSPIDPFAGVGLRLGETASLSRVRVRDVRWAGIVINGDSDGSTVSYADLDDIADGEQTGGVGIYLDNVARNTTVQNFCVGPTTRIAVNSEWDHWCDHAKPGCSTPTTEMFSRGIDNTVKDGLSQSSLFGVHFDQGTVGGHVEGMIFRNYTRAGIGLHHNISDENLWPAYDDGSTHNGNTFEEPQHNCTICDVTYSVWNDQTPQCVGEPAC